MQQEMNETKINSKLTFVEYKTSPKPEGLLSMCLGAILAILTTIALIIKDFDSNDRIVFPLMAYGATAWLLAFGVYYRYFRYKPMKRTVMLGNRPHRIFMRSRKLFIVYTLLIYIALYFAVVLIIDFFADGFSFDKATIMDDLAKGSGILLLIAPYKIVSGFLDYHQYYLSLNATSEKND